MTLPKPPNTQIEIMRAMVDINAQLENRELGQMQAMANRWRGVENALELQIRRTIEAIQMRQEAGQPVGRSAISNLESYRELLKQISGQARDYEKYASGVIGNEQLAYGKIGITTAQDMLKIGGMVDFNRLNVRAVQNMVGITADGSPLFDVLKKRALAPEMVSGLTDYLVEAIAMGYNPRKTAEMMANGLAAGLTKALTIARTEQVRAYRQASVDQYRQTGVIEQFQRHAVPAERTCLACLALDGEIQDSKEAIASHPNCRCFVTPIIPGFSAPEFGSGEDWLRTQNEAVQRKVLGARFEAWQGGTPLRDMVKITLDKTWGPTIGVRSLGEMAGMAALKPQAIMYNDAMPGNDATTKQAIEIIKMQSFGAPSDHIAQYLDDNGIDYVYGYHATSVENAHSIKLNGIKTSSQENRPDASYFFLDKRDVNDNANILGLHGDYALITIRIPKKYAANIKDDGFFNGTFPSSYSAARLLMPIPPEWIGNMYKIIKKP